MARLAPGRTVQQLRHLFDHRVRARLTEAPSARDHDRRVFELRTGALFDVRLVVDALPRPRTERRRRGAATTVAAGPPDGSAAKDLARTTMSPGPSPVNLASHRLRSAKDGVLGDESTLVDETGHVRQDRSVQSGRQSSRDVATVVARRNRGSRRARPRSRSSASMAEATGTPGKAPPRSPTS